MKYLFLLVVVFLFSLEAKAAVGGYAYLADKTSHEGIQVRFDSVSLTARSATAITNPDGYYTAEIKPGVYKVTYLYPDYESYYMNAGKDVLIIENDTLPDITLQKIQEIKISGYVSDTLFRKNQYLVVGGIQIKSNTKLYIESGTNIKFSIGTRLLINGKILAQGTAENPIIFTSVSKEPTNGDWEGILTYQCDSSSVFKGCKIEYAVTGFHINYSTFEISHCDIDYTKENGILITNSNARIYSNHITNFKKYGIYQFNEGSSVIECNTISNGLNDGIRIRNGTAKIINNKIYAIKDPFYEYWTKGINLTEKGDVLIRNNYIYSCNYGIMVNGYEPLFADIINNTINKCNYGIQFGNALSPLSAWGKIRNNIIFNNNTGICQFNYSDERPSVPEEISFNLLKNEMDFNSVQITGLGFVITKNNIGIPCDTYYNIFVDPLFDEDNMPGLLANSPAINSGDPNIEEPDGTASDIGANFVFYYCGNDTILDVENDFPLNENADGLFIYPNPAGDEIVIAKSSEGFHPSEGYKLSICNSIGECVLSAEIKPTDSHRIIVSHLPAGVYSAVLINKFNLNSICGRLVIVR